MRKLLLGAATVITSLGLTAGVAAAQTGGSIDTTGPNSRATIRSSQHTSTHVRNHNDLRVYNTNHQRASSGDATVSNNTTGGDATSGAASNDNQTSVDATVKNNSADIVHAALSNASDPSGDGGSISNTGPNSNASIHTNVDTHTSVNNTNNLHVTNSSTQSAYSGDATVSNNTTGGDATSGDAYNSNSSSFTLSVSN